MTKPVERIEDLPLTPDEIASVKASSAIMNEASRRLLELKIMPFPNNLATMLRIISDARQDAARGRAAVAALRTTYTTIGARFDTAPAVLRKVDGDLARREFDFQKAESIYAAQLAKLKAPPTAAN